LPIPTKKCAGRPSFAATAAAVLGPLTGSGVPEEPALLVLPPFVLPPLALVMPPPPALFAPFDEDELPQPSTSAIVEPTANEPQRYFMRAC
jgi:hypothetical protein